MVEGDTWAEAAHHFEGEINQQRKFATQMLNDGRQIRSKRPGRMTGESLTPPGKCRDVTKPNMHKRERPGCRKPTWNLVCITQLKNAQDGPSWLSLLFPITYAQGRWPQKINFQGECKVSWTDAQLTYGGCCSHGARSNSFNTTLLRECVCVRGDVAFIPYDRKESPKHKVSEPPDLLLLSCPTS